jgi:predicted phage terminase large subunit-like protein
MTPAEEAKLHIARQEKARSSLYWFCRHSFQKQRGYRWQGNAHHATICAKLEDVFHGRCRRLIINMPPRYSKTEIAVVSFITWAMGRAPDSEFIHASYAARLAESNAARARDVMWTRWYRELFPRVRIDPRKRAAGDWRTTAGGVVFATGAGGTITGFGAGKMRADSDQTFGGAIIIDDPHKAAEATSDTIRHNVIDWFRNTLESRVNAPGTPIILIMQRLHEEDLAGWLLAGGNGETWEHLCIPVLNEAGEPLWPRKHDLAAIERMRTAKPYEFAGQYMQRPAPIGGGIFKIDWWRFFAVDALPPPRRIVQSWDTAFKTNTTNDYSVCTTWAETERGFYLLDLWKQKAEFPELKRMVASKAAQQWGGQRVNAVLVEDKASGQSLVQELRRDTMLPIIPVKVDSDKISRAFAVTALIQSGRVFLPEGADWVADYVASHAAFPNGTHDDDVDSTTQALIYLARGSGLEGWLAWADARIAGSE